MRFGFGIDSVAPGALPAGWDPALATLSVAIACSASFVTIVLLASLTEHPGAAGRPMVRALSIAAAACLGIGGWSAHFLALLALRLPFERSFDWTGTAASLGVLLVTATAVVLLMHRRAGPRQAAGAGVVAGCGLTLVQLVGFEAMRFPGDLWLRGDRVLLGAAAAIGLAIAAFSLVLERRGPEPPWGARTLVAAALLASAVAAMGAAGTWAARFDSDGSTIPDALILDPALMAASIVALLVVLLSFSLLAVGAARRVHPRLRLVLVGLLMAALAVGVGATTLALLYDASFRAARSSLIDAVELRAATMGRRFGDVSFDLPRVAAASGERFYLLRAGVPRAGAAGSAMPVIVGRAAARAAREGSGTLLGTTERGEVALVVFAATGSGFVVVGTLPLAGIRAPFVRSGLGAAIVAAIFLALAIALGRGIAEPMLQSLGQKERLEAELDIARSVQIGLMPLTLPSVSGFAVAMHSTPARELGGDFFDFVELGTGERAANHRLGVIVGDVAGKGVSAALHVARLLGDFRHAVAGDPEPGSVLSAMNAMLLRDAGSGMFASAVYLLLEPRRVLVANAGHQPVLLRGRDGTVERIGAASGPPLGIVDSRYEAESTAIGGGDQLVVYTDGVTESRDEHRRWFGEAALCDALAGELASPGAVVDAVIGALAKHRGEAPRADDLTLVAIGVER